jgi:hypothetical protein
MRTVHFPHDTFCSSDVTVDCDGEGFEAMDAVVSNLGRVIVDGIPTYGSLGSDGNMYIVIDKKAFRVQDFVALAFGKLTVETNGFHIDHIDKNKTNNRIDNLVMKRNILVDVGVITPGKVETRVKIEEVFRSLPKCGFRPVLRDFADNRVITVETRVKSEPVPRSKKDTVKCAATSTPTTSKTVQKQNDDIDKDVEEQKRVSTTSKPVQKQNDNMDKDVEEQKRISTTSTKVQAQNDDINKEIAEDNRRAAEKKRLLKMTIVNADPPIVTGNKPRAISENENLTQKDHRLKRERKRTEATSASLNKKKSEHDRCFARLTRMTKFAAPELPELDLCKSNCREK